LIIYPKRPIHRSLDVKVTNVFHKLYLAPVYIYIILRG
jgi:hypothetical protein